MADTYTLSPAGQQSLSTPPDHPDVQQALALLNAMTQENLRFALANHVTHYTSYQGKAGGSVSVDGFGSMDLETGSQCIVYDQSHYLTTASIDGMYYNLGWSQRLVVKVKTTDSKVNVTIPSTIAASCELNQSSATALYQVMGLATVNNFDDLSGTFKPFNLDYYTQYVAKLAALTADLSTGAVRVVAVALSSQPAPGNQAASSPDEAMQKSRAAAYRMCAISGLRADQTANDWFDRVTTQGRDLKNRPEPIADPKLLRSCIDEAYADYGVPRGAKPSSIGEIAYKTLKDRLTADADAYVATRQPV